MNINKRFLAFLFVIFISTVSTYAQTEESIQGTWKARGYGWVAEIDAETIRIYDFTSISCMVSAEYPIATFIGGVSVIGKVLTMKRGVTEYTLDHIPNLPNLCTQQLSKKERKDPFYNFDVLWHTFNEQYAYFKERNVDWQKLYDVYRNQINLSISKVKLFSIFNAMLDELNDGHVGIEASDKLMKKAAVLGNWDTRPNPDFRGLRSAIISKYIKEPKRHNISRTVWGTINDSIGYLQINSMGVQGDYGITAATSAEEAKKLYLKYLSKTADPFMDDINGMNTTMKKVLKDLENTKKIILDLRFNGGGEDMVGLTALSYFIDSEKIVFNKKNRIKSSYSKSYPFQLSPAENVYSGELYILQSSYSASATEVLLLASLAYENIQRLGSSSEGIFSDILDKKLPNGWEFGLSNQVYEDKNGISYEAKGIPVDVEFNYPKDYYMLVDKLKKDLEQSGDLAIEKVLQK